MKEGVFDYQTKGDSDDQLLVVVNCAMDRYRLGDAIFFRPACPPA